MATTTKNMQVTAGNANASVTAQVTDSMPGVPCPGPAGYTYKGLRYVPVFADPIEWNSANSYEALTIVIHEGNSYTSKMAVPIGIDIMNETFWVKTFDFNAQLELVNSSIGKVEKEYLKIFDNVQSMINDLSLVNNMNIKVKGYYAAGDGGESIYNINETEGIKLENGLFAKLLIDEVVTPEMFGAVGDGITDDSNAFQLAVNSGSRVFLAGKKYLLAKYVELPNCCSIIGHSMGTPVGASQLICKGGGLSQIGESIMSGGIHKRNLLIENVYIYSDSTQTDYPVKLICTTYVYFYNVFVYGNRQILMWELFDSCFYGCSFEWAGSAENNVFGVEIASGNRGISGNPVYENTNTCYFFGCRFESGSGNAIVSTGTAGNNNIKFYGCHIESFQAIKPYINLSSIDACGFNGCSFVCDSNMTTPFANMVNMNGLTINDCYIYRVNQNKNGLGTEFGNKQALYIAGNNGLYIDIPRVYDPNNTLPGTYSKYVGTYDNTLYENGYIKVSSYSNQKDYFPRPESKKQIGCSDGVVYKAENKMDICFGALTAGINFNNTIVFRFYKSTDGVTFNEFHDYALIPYSLDGANPQTVISMNFTIEKNQYWKISFLQNKPTEFGAYVTPYSHGEY